MTYYSLFKCRQDGNTCILVQFKLSILKYVLDQKKYQDGPINIHSWNICCWNKLTLYFILKLRSIRLKVEEARSSMQASKSQGRVITALLEAKTRGVLPGVLGRLVSNKFLKKQIVILYLYWRMYNDSRLIQKVMNLIRLYPIYCAGWPIPSYNLKVHACIKKSINLLIGKFTIKNDYYWN